MGTQKKHQEDFSVLEKQKDLHKIILFNDEFNTFDYVINMLIKVCDHTNLQAEQCSIIVHNNGKCDVKTGEYSDLKPRCSKLLEAGLSAELV